MSADAAEAPAGVDRRGQINGFLQGELTALMQAAATAELRKHTVVEQMFSGSGDAGSFAYEIPPMRDLGALIQWRILRRLWQHVLQSGDELRPVDYEAAMVKVSNLVQVEVLTGLRSRAGGGSPAHPLDRAALEIRMAAHAEFLAEVGRLVTEIDRQFPLPKS